MSRRTKVAQHGAQANRPRDLAGARGRRATMGAVTLELLLGLPVLLILLIGLIQLAMI
jgi:Flp pilus assembly protein TadG